MRFQDRKVNENMKLLRPTCTGSVGLDLGIHHLSGLACGDFRSSQQTKGSNSHLSGVQDQLTQIRNKKVLESSTSNFIFLPNSDVAVSDAVTTDTAPCQHRHV